MNGFGVTFLNPARAVRRLLWLALALAGSLLLLFTAIRPAAAGVPAASYTLIVVKQAWQSNGLDPYPGDWSFEYTCDSADFDCLEFTLTDEDPNYTYPAIAEANSLTLTEDNPGGWTVSVSCKNQNNFEITGGTDSVNLTHDLVNGGDLITCVFTNIAEPTTADLTLVKETDPDGGKEFPFTLDPGTVTFEHKWGSNGVTGGTFNAPFGAAIDSAGNLYVADTFDYRVQKFDAAGNFLRAWGWDVVVGGGTGFEICTIAANCWSGDSGGGDGQFNQPHAVIVVGSTVYVADSGNQRIQMFDTDGNFLRMFGWGVDDGTAALQTCTAGCQAGLSGGGNGQFNQPNGLAVDGAGNLYVADAFNNRVQKFDANRNFLLAWGRDVVAGGTTDFEICTPADTCKAGTTGSGVGHFTTPFGVAVLGTVVYVADTFNNRIQMFDLDGTPAGGWGGAGSGNGQFVTPYSIATDAAGHLYVADSGNDRVQKFDSQGGFLAKWGSAGAGDGQFDLPIGVAVAAGGDVYVVDYNAHRVQRFGQNGVVLDDNESYQFIDLAPGTYLASELVPAGWDLTGIVCDGGNPAESGSTVEVTLAAGDDVTCTFTNSNTSLPTTAALTITKIVSGAGAPVDWSFAFTGSLGNFSLTDDDPNEVGTNLVPRDFDISETNPAGYTTTASCDNGDSANDGNLSVTLAAGDNVECTYTNALCQPGTFDTATSWACTLADPGHFVDTPGAAAQTPCAPGFYQPAAGAALCIQADPGYYAPGPGATEQIACPRGTTSPAGSDSVDDCVPATGTIIIEKLADPADGTIFAFNDNIEDAGGFFLQSSATKTFSNVPAGEYAVNEYEEDGWTLDDIQCDDDDSSGSNVTRLATIKLSAGETVTCTFFNVKETTPPPANTCPAEYESNQWTDLLGIGMGTPKAHKVQAKVVIPNWLQSVDLYGQLVAKNMGAANYVRFLYPGTNNFVQVNAITSFPEQQAGTFWYGTDLNPAPHIRGRWFLQKSGIRGHIPRALVLYPTYNDPLNTYVNVWDTFDAFEGEVDWNVAAGWTPYREIVVPIAAPLGETDFHVELAVVDNDNDKRPVWVTVSAGGVTLTQKPLGPNKAPLLNLMVFDLKDVPAGTDEIVIEIYSPSLALDGVIGDSATLVGMVANYKCEPLGER